MTYPAKWLHFRFDNRTQNRFISLSMKLKNVSGAAISLSLGKVSSVQALANNGTFTIPDTDPEAIQQALNLAKAGKLEVLTPPAGYELVPYNSVPPHVLVTVGTGAALPDSGDKITLAGVDFVVDLDPATALDCATALKTAINANATMIALGVVARDVLETNAGGDNRASLFIDLSAVKDYTGFTAVTSDAAKLALSKVAVAEKALKQVVRKVTLAGVAATTPPVVVSGLRTVVAAYALLRTSTGAQKAVDGVLTFSGGLVCVDLSGSVDVADDDELVLIALGY